MASLIFDSCLDDVVRGLIDFDTDAFWCMLVDASYVPDKAGDLTVADVSGEVTGTGYTAEGKVAAVSVAKDTTNHRIDVSLGSNSWPGATIGARGAIYYKKAGGAPSGWPLVAYIDFGALITSTNGTFSLSASTLRLQN